VSLDESWGFRLEDAVDRFNESGSVRTVAGLMRTLGVPRISIGAAAGSADEVRITVAWELCWYQWGVDTRDPSAPVVELAKGAELAELDGSARVWNGGVEGGRLHLGSAPPPPLSRGERLRRALT
jgi:hypothetical protein